MSITISLENAPLPADIKALRTSLSQYNVARVPNLLDQPRGAVAILARDAEKRIIGGAVGDYDWGWLYVDTLWVDMAHRKNGLGARLLTAIEQHAYTAGISHVYLMTTSFQAQPFYAKKGYVSIGQIDDHPRGHQMIYLKKTITPLASTTQFEVQSPPNANTIHWLDERFKEDTLVPLENHRLAVLMRDTAGRIRGGLYGGTFWDWFDLRYLWIDEAYRGRGLARQLFTLAEEECRRRGILGIVTDTASFQALPVYEALGFDVFATLPDRPTEHTTYFVQKRLG